MQKKFTLNKIFNHNTFGILISAIFLILVFYNLNISEVIASVKTFNFWYAIPAILIYSLSYIIRAFRWKELLSVTKNINYSSVLKALYIGYMANTLLPARMGEIYRAHIIGTEQNIKRSGALASIFVERVFDGLTLVTLMTFLILFYNKMPLLVNICYTTGAIFLTSFIVILIASKKSSVYHNTLSFILKMIPKAISKKIEHIINRIEGMLTAFIEGLGVLKSIKALIFIICTSAMAWALECLATYSLILGFNLHSKASFVLVGFLIVLVAFSTMIPSGPGFIGPYQCAFILAFKLFGVGKSTAVAISVTTQTVLMGPVVIIGLILLWKSHLKLGKIPNNQLKEGS